MEVSTRLAIGEQLLDEGLYLRSVASTTPCASLRARKAAVTSVMVGRCSRLGAGASGSGVKGGSTLGAGFASSWEIAARAASHSHCPVLLRCRLPPRVPAANIGQSQRRKPFLRSSNSPVRESST